MAKSIFLSDAVGAIYRKGIFQLLDKTYDVEWLFGISGSTVKSIADTDLRNINRKPIRKIVGNWYWQSGTLGGVFFKKKDAYILDGGIYSLANWCALLINTFFLKPKKIYLWSHGWYGRENVIKQILKKIYFNMATGSLFYGNYAKKQMLKYGANVDKVKVIHNSLDYDVQKRLRIGSLSTNIVKAHFQNDNPTIVFIGRLTKSKKLHMIVNAVSTLQRKGIDMNVLFIGTGEIEDSLKALCKKHNINSWFYGACYDEDVNAQLVAQSDICVSPGNVGLTAMHSLMFGTPVITHATFSNQMPEFEAIIPNVTGAFFEENNVESLANTIEAWLKNKNNRSKIRQNCYAEIDNSWNPYFQLKVIEEIMQDGN